MTATPPVTASPNRVRTDVADRARYWNWFWATEGERVRLEDSFRSSYTILAGNGGGSEVDVLTRSAQPLSVLCNQHTQAIDALWSNARRTRPSIPAECRSLDTLYSQAFTRERRVMRALCRSVNGLDSNGFRTTLEQLREVQADFASAATVMQQMRR